MYRFFISITATNIGVQLQKQRFAPLAQSVERIHGKDGVAGSIPAGGSTKVMTSGNAGQRFIL
jgi:hypothetical protein